MNCAVCTTARAWPRSAPVAVCTDAGTTRPALWSTKSEAAAGALAEVLAGPMRDALEAPPHPASAKAKAAVTTAVNVAVRRRLECPQRGVSELWDAGELLMGERSLATEVVASVQSLVGCPA